MIAIAIPRTKKNLYNIFSTNQIII